MNPDPIREFFVDVMTEALRRAEVPSPEVLHRRRGFSATRLAQAVGVSPATVRRIETGDMQCLEQHTLHICQRIAQELNESEVLYLEAVQRQIDRKKAS